MKHYRNLFVECGYSEEEVSAKIREVWEKLFLEEESKARIYYTDDMGGYLLDTGNDDARSEGMSYGMMMAVQMGDKEIFDKIWAWSYKNMYHQEGFNKGYFAWHCTTDGKKLDDGPAPDGEEFFAMALFLQAIVGEMARESIIMQKWPERSFLTVCTKGMKEKGMPCGIVIII